MLPKWRKPTSFTRPAQVPTVHIYIQNPPPEPDHPPSPSAGCGQFLTWLRERSRAPDEIYSRLCEMTDAEIFELKSVYMY